MAHGQPANWPIDWHSDWQSRLTPAERRRARGEGAVYRRADGRWEGQLRLPDGSRKAVYAKTQREVLVRLRETRRDLDRGLPVRSADQLTSDYLKQWLQAAQATVRPRTFDSYRLNVVTRLEPLIGRHRLSAVTPAIIQSAYGQLLARGLSPRSVEQAHTVLHRAFAQVRWDLVGRNPVALVSPPRPAHREMSTLSAGQLATLWAASAGDRYHALWVLLGTTGLRLGEALGLRWDDVDLDGRRLTVRRALQRQVPRGLVFVEPKTARSRRTVHLADVAVDALRGQAALNDLSRQAAGSWAAQDLVFPNMTGGPTDGRVVLRALKRTLARAGLPVIRVHDLRHTAATILLEAGAHPKIVQDLLGHSTITLTLDTYSHVTPALHGDAAQRLNRVFPVLDRPS